jgi:hypothetical protein
MKRYIVKRGEWFDEGTEAFLLGVIHDGMGLFKGTRTGMDDEELCHVSEFEVIEE